MKLFTVLRPVVLLALLTENVFAWGGRVHMDMNRAAAINVPDDMAAWRDYASLLSRGGIWPDLWKSDDETEGFRHYLDTEQYQPLALTNLSESLAGVRALATGASAAKGVVPWVIMDVERKMTEAMRSNDWENATRYAAALGHYLGDAYQPLHLTEHYNDNPGPDGKGVHLRWEEQMPFFFWKENLIHCGPAMFIQDPWSRTLQQLNQAYAKYHEIYQADREATEVADDEIGSSEYYRALWSRTENLFTKQVSAAATDLSSLWYTAWVQAGRPRIPQPPKTVSMMSIWKVQPVAVVKSSSHPFLLTLAGMGVILLLISMARRRK